MQDKTALPFLLIDISNTFTKIAPANKETIHTQEIQKIPTKELTTQNLQPLLSTAKKIILSSVVPEKTTLLQKLLPPQKLLLLDHTLKLPFTIDYPEPHSIGADRLANLTALSLECGAPAIAIDLGTATTFDILYPDNSFRGGIIAPGFHSMSQYLHTNTALLPEVPLTEPPRLIGHSTQEAILSGAIHGFRGLINELTHKLLDHFEKKYHLTPKLTLTGGDTSLITQHLPPTHTINRHLTLQGLHYLAQKNS